MTGSPVDRELLAVGRAKERRATEERDAALTRERALEAELSRTYAELLEMRGLRLDTRVSDPQAERIADVRELFAEIQARNAGADSLVTVVIPIYGKLDYTLRCLRSIAVTWSDVINPTIVVVDDASPDDSGRRLAGIPNIDLVRNRTNLGFLRSSNRGAALAGTKYTCFLNNDTEVRNGWLDWLVVAAEEDDKIGVVGSKLVYPDGKLQDAGSIIWTDATGWNVGRGDDPELSAYNYRREVDYCSGASLMIRTDLLRDIGGFDERFAPAYYEDADLCFEVRARGLKVVYEPRSEVVHYEGVTSGTDLSSGAKRYQAINRPKFAQKWEDALLSQYAPSADNVTAAMERVPAGKTVLVIDSYVPMYDREAGSNRLFKVISIMRNLGYHVAFLPDNYAAPEPYAQALLALGVEVLHARPNGPTPERALLAALSRADLVWVCRPELCERYLPTIRANCSAPVVYDTIDLHFVRERRRAEVEGLGDLKWRGLRELELRLAGDVDAVVTVTNVEREELRLHGIEHIFVLPTIHDPETHAGLGFDARRGLVFIGGYGHTPNVDAVEWLCRDVMPRVWERVPNVPLTLLGNNPPESVRDLASPRVTVPGFVADVTEYFEEARVFVAPLRYGAGMKGKIGQALSFGLPVVTTTIGVEGFDLVDRKNCLIADDAAAFVDAILELYQTPELWDDLSAGSLEAIKPLGSEAVRETLRQILTTLLETTPASATNGSGPEPAAQRSLIIYGNCQGDALAHLMRSDPVVSEFFRIVYLPSFDNRVANASNRMESRDVERAAVLMEQHDPNPFPQRSLLPDDCLRLTFPALDFMLLWPLSCPNPYNAPPSEAYPWGPFPYGDRAIIDCVERGMDVDEILAHYFSATNEYLPNLDHLHRIESGRLTARDAKCDVRMAGFVFEQFRRKRLFWCNNHPSLAALRELVNRLLERVAERYPGLREADLNFAAAGFTPEGPLAFPRVPIHPAVAAHFGLTWIDVTDPDERYGFAANLLGYEGYFRQLASSTRAQYELKAPART